MALKKIKAPRKGRSTTKITIMRAPEDGAKSSKEKIQHGKTIERLKRKVENEKVKDGLIQKN
ncbi:MAG: hypothetical protein PHI66_03315 [Candidatus Pacebacteria bacterium]|nr:hypothetical protein [Candidatus Paceibacterota bacterium]